MSKFHFISRASDIFPVRQQRFLCDDARYYQSYEDANTERNYIILSNLTLYLVCLIVPIIVVRRKKEKNQILFCGFLFDRL
jgi:hypothetical protein